MLSKLNSIGIYFIVAVLVVVPLYPKFPLANLFESFVAVRLEDFLIAFVIGAWAVHQYYSKFTSCRPPVARALLIYLSIGFISIFWAILVTQTATPGTGLLHTFRRVA